LKICNIYTFCYHFISCALWGVFLLFLPQDPVIALSDLPGFFHFFF
jgi:hypothetical protein